jgi:hypothetical protein
MFAWGSIAADHLVGSPTTQIQACWGEPAVRWPQVDRRMSRGDRSSGGGGAVLAVAVLIGIAVGVVIVVGAVAVLVVGITWTLITAAIDARHARRTGTPARYVAAVRLRGGAAWGRVRAPGQRKTVLVVCFVAGLAVLISYAAVSGGRSETTASAGSSETAASGGTSSSDPATPAVGKSSAHRVSRPPHPRHHPNASPHRPLGPQTKVAGCRVKGVLPDPACTPGAIFSAASLSQICTPGYSRSVRNVPESVKEGVYAAYGIQAHAPRSYEVDHLVPLELGGNNSVANLWPEVTPGYHKKDAIENSLHDAACAEQVSLRTAQREIARDWRHTFAGAPSVVPERSTQTSTAPATSAAGSSTSAADFCSTHTCIPSFSEGHGPIVQCADGEWSHSGGRPGVCSRHGGPR